MRIGIIGAGAIGSVVGGLLTKAGHDVTLADQWPEHVEQMRKHGLRLSGTCGEHLIPVNAIHIHELQKIAEPFEAAFVAVKSYDTEWATALRTLARFCARGVSVPSSSPILKPTLPLSVRMACPGSYIPAPMVMTQPSVRSLPATAATRWSLMPFWKSTTTPSGRRRYWMASAVAHSVS